MDYAKYLSPTGPMAPALRQAELDADAGQASLPSPSGRADRQDGPRAGGIRVAGRAQLEDLRAHQNARTRPHVAREADKRVFLYQHLQLKVKIEDAGFKPALIEWDEVSSEEEEDDAASELPEL